MKQLILLVMIQALLSSSSLAQSAFPLYDSIPNSKKAMNTETSETTGGILRISDVSVPVLTMYTPTTLSSKTAAIIICPGGGYARLAASHEGSDVAKEFTGWGITAFVLKYRLPDDSIMTDKSIGPLQDAQRAIQLVRQNAAAWNIDPHKIGIMGFSAGGHLAATASTHFDRAVIENNNNIDLRPDFSILIYPVISFSDSLAHWGSRNNLLGKSASREKVWEYSNEEQVNAKTPPAFIMHTTDDKTVKVENSKKYYKALRKNQIAAELKIYEQGGHGFGMHNKTTTDSWMLRLKSWLQTNHFL